MTNTVVDNKTKEAMNDELDEKPDNGAPKVTGVKAQDVSFDQAVEEEKENKETVSSTKEEDVLDVLQPKAKSVKWTIGPENMQREYIQRPLSFIAKIQWFSLVGEVVDQAISGPNGLSVGSLLTPPGSRGNLSIDDFRDADTFVAAIGKLLTVAPDFLVKSYCIWLSVPDYERDLAKELMSLPEDEGGLSDSDGIAIIETFIDQNYEALDNFFRNELSRLQTRVQQRAKEASESRQ